MSRLTAADFEIRRLGETRIPSPLRWGRFLDDEHQVRLKIALRSRNGDQPDLLLQPGGPRARLFFDPQQTTAAIVTCGGICPGLNNVIRSIVQELQYNYEVPRILGIRYGYLGLTGRGSPPMPLNSERVADIQHLGGTILGSSRGPQEPAEMLEFLRRNNVQILFCLGGDGTQRGAAAIDTIAREQNYPLSVVGIPKTIDNDVPFVDLSFGHVTALEQARAVLQSAHVEARGFPNGIAIVKLMGRDAGFIAAGAAITSGDANFVLIPEVPFPLTGSSGFLTLLEQRMQDRGHALIVAAEGAGQHLFSDQVTATDGSGNRRYHDIGLFLKERISEYFAEKKFPVTLKYLDPSYQIRSVPANTWDCWLCDQMARNAVHAGMAGYTGLLIGSIHNEFVHVPIQAAVQQKRQLDLQGDLWSAVLAATGQPEWMPTV